MGTVYQGRSPGGRLVAVKMARPELAADVGFRSRFRSEVEAARRVGGFHTAQVVDADPDADPPWMVTAYIPGRPLDAVIVEDGPMGHAELRELGAALAEALVAIHSCDLVHRDLKPSNIIMTDDGPRVLDFGIARALDETRLTNTSMVVGTPGFLAPEQIGSGLVGPACDVFALGAVLVHAAGGRAFGEGGHMALMYRAVHDDPELTALPDPLRRLVAQCLAKDPGTRPTAEQLLTALAPTADGAAARNTATGVPPLAHSSAQTSVTAVNPDSVTIRPTRQLAATRPTMGSGPQAVTFRTPWTARVAALTPVVFLCLVPSGLAAYLFSTGATWAWALVLPALPGVLGILSLLMRGRSSVRLDADGVTTRRGTWFGTKWDRVPWEDVAAVDVRVGERPLAVLKLGMFDDAPLPFGATGDPVFGPIADVHLLQRIEVLDPDGTRRRLPGSAPREAARVALDAVRRFAPETLSDEEATTRRPAATTRGTGDGDRPRRDTSQRSTSQNTVTHMEFTRSPRRKAAAGGGWLFLTVCCGALAYMIWGRGTFPDNLFTYVLGIASITGLVLFLGKTMLPQGLTVTLDADGISVHSRAERVAPATTQVIPWRDVAAVSPADNSEGLDCAIEIRVHEGRPLPRRQHGLVPEEPNRLKVTVPHPSTVTAETKRLRIAALVRQLAPEVHTDYL
ncbi:serine/threonine-protein kinase [Streptomyces sp. NPDC089424]|uniref:serine/threonine-protein kinase n=1 Tax=Streptomyces sp. NPDC089424 TaxID=3365917 RepID=UPI0037F52006